MSAIRTVLYTEEYPLQLGKGGVFNLASKETKKQNPVESRRLPQRFVQDEIDRARLQDSWNTFCEGVDVLRGIKGNVLMNGLLKRATIRSGMARLCSDFNRKTQNTLVEFRYLKQGLHRTRYYIQLVQLSHVSNQVRNAKGMTAEIPACFPHAHLITADSTDDGANKKKPSSWVPYTSGRSYSNRNSRIQWAPSAVVVNDDGSDPPMVTAEAEIVVDVSSTYCDATPL